MAMRKATPAQKAKNFSKISVEYSKKIPKRLSKVFEGESCDEYVSKVNYWR